MKGNYDTQIPTDRTVPLHVGRCVDDIAKTVFGDKVYEKTFGETKKETGECDTHDRSLAHSKNADETAESESLGNDTGTEFYKNIGVNIPDSSTTISMTGSQTCPSCVNHAAKNAHHQLVAMDDNFNLRPPNEGESSEAQYRIRERAAEFARRAKEYVSTRSNLRNQIKFEVKPDDDEDYDQLSATGPGRTKRPDYDDNDDDIEFYPQGQEVPTGTKVDLKTLLENYNNSEDE
jgi:hypothetical protein